MSHGNSSEVVIVGVGPAGLAVSQQLAARGIGSLALERGSHPGWMWSKVYDSLRLHTGKHLSALPGMPFPKGTSLFPRLGEFTAYLSDYAQRFAIPVSTGVEARALEQTGGGWRVTADGGVYEARCVVVATGIMSSPSMPSFAVSTDCGGRVIHSSEYRRPDGYRGQRVLVAGAGNSGAEIASELAEAGVEVAVSVRSGANVVPLSIAGIPIQYLGWALSLVPGLPLASMTRAMGSVGAALKGGSVIPRVIPRKSGADGCPDVPLIGNRLVGHMRSGTISLLPGVTGVTPGGVRFADGTEREFDSVILATGYRAAIDWMGEYGERDECGFAQRIDRVRSPRHRGLYFIGHNYDGRGGLCNIAMDAKRIARLVNREMRGEINRDMQGGYAR